MPSLTITLPAGAITPAHLDSIAARLPEPLLEIEGLPAVPLLLETSWAAVHELETFYAGARRTGDALVRVDVTTLEGLVDADDRRAMVRVIARAFADVAEVPAERVLVVFHLSEAIGFGGDLVDAEGLRALAASLVTA